jgi:adenylate kinase
LATRLGIGYLSTGALLRAEVAAGTALGKRSETLLARGEFLPDELMCPILRDWLSQQTQGWVLDGFPRSLPQALFLDEWLAQHALTVDVAVSLEVPYAELLARMSNRMECQQCRWTGQRVQLDPDGLCPVCHGPAGPRLDDTEENFKNRYTEFMTLTGPVIEHYRALGRLFACEAVAHPDEVAAQLLSHLTALSA